MKNEYTFPAIFYFDEYGISIEFPDLPGCLPCHDTAEAVKNAKEVLGSHLYGMEKDGKIIPEASDLKDIEVEDCGVLMLVDVFMPTVRDRINNKFVKNALYPFLAKCRGRKTHSDTRGMGSDRKRKADEKGTLLLLSGTLRRIPMRRNTCLDEK